MKQRPSSVASSERPWATSTTTNAIPRGQALRGDGDADNPSDIDGNGDADSASTGGPDNDQDSPTRASYELPDRDDRATLAYGHRPDAGARHAITELIERYYAAAAAHDGRRACSMLAPQLARSLAEDYGRAPGPSYLRGSTSCETVMTRLFEHTGDQLAQTITVIEVRTAGEHAQVVLGSRSMPASAILLARQGGSWKIEQTLGQPLP